MVPLFIADASALLEITKCVPPKNLTKLWLVLTEKVETSELGFPRAVVNDLSELARSERVGDWAHGLGSSLNNFSPHIKYQRWLMGIVQEKLGFDNGFEGILGKDSSKVHVGMLARQVSQSGREVTIVTEDFGEAPLGPTMQQLCDVAGWPYVSMRQYLSGIDDCKNLLG